GINNFSYIQSPFSFKKDLDILYRIYPFKNVGIIVPPEFNQIFPNFNEIFTQALDSLNTRFTVIKAQNNASATTSAIPSEVDAAYVMPLFDELGEAEMKQFLDQLADKKLPSVALLGGSMVEIGALAGYESEANLAKIPRRLAIDILKIVDGQNAADLPVKINTFGESIIINMNTVRKVGTYPNWDIVSEAILLNASEVETDRVLSLQTVIMEALDRNLSLKVSQINPLLAQKEVNLAQSELLPQLDANSVISLLDPNSAKNSFGTRGRLNWSAGGSLSQLVYAEPALANVAIQKLLQQGETYGLQTDQLDVVADAAEAFLNVLQAQRFMEIQASNVSVTKNNLDIARAKDAVGYSGATDLNRWKSELALAKIDLNDAQARFEQAKYALNQFLNHPVNEDFRTENIGAENQLLIVTDQRLIDNINNERELEKLADFLVKEAFDQLPELKQIDASLAAQQRLLKSRKRAFYLPSFALSGSWDYTFQRWDVTETPGLPTQEVEPSWNLGLAVQYPIFQGGKRRFDQEVVELNISQIEYQQTDLRNQLELRVRSTLQTASASFFRVDQYKEALSAANENFDIVQDSYSQGLVSVTNLIDAQNARVQTELGAANAGYQFILDFLDLERSIGFYYQLSSAAQQAAFFDRLTTFMLENE
ncbi:MAG: TolC family protein, partial [Bacteroidota bacterium]